MSRAEDGADFFRERYCIMIHLAIYQNDRYTLLMEYELIGDAITLTSVDVQERPRTQFEQRDTERRPAVTRYPTETLLQLETTLELSR